MQRRIVGNGCTFGPGGHIEFVGLAPQGEDALYVNENLYQVAVDRSHVRKVRISTGSAGNHSMSYLREEQSNLPLKFHSQSPTGDPWIEQNQGDIRNRVFAQPRSDRQRFVERQWVEPSLNSTSEIAFGHTIPWRVICYEMWYRKLIHSS